MAVRYQYGDKVWWVARATCGYVTRAFESEKDANDALQMPEDSIYQQVPVDPSLLASFVRHPAIPSGWRVLCPTRTQLPALFIFETDTRVLGDEAFSRDSDAIARVGQLCGPVARR
ncbi:MAG: hypothetical protein K2X49_16630 [Acetobacteraceae bacterium]|nr:hypothetical protein [Acetobacteraceae bacterium]